MGWPGVGASVFTMTAIVELSTPKAILDGPGGLPEGMPAFWTARRAAAWKRFQELPMPKRKDEDWRFANIRALELEAYGTGQAPGEQRALELLAESKSDFTPSASAVFANDILLKCEDLPEALAEKGVRWLALEDALREVPEMVEEHFMTEGAPLGSAKFAALHEAHCRAGIVLYVPRNVTIEEPFAIHHWTGGSRTAVFPHTLIIAGANSSCGVEYFHSWDEAASFACSVRDCHLGAGAKVSYFGCQDWNTQSVGIQISSTVLERDASAQSLNLNLGAHFARMENQSVLNGPGARSEMLSLSCVDGRQEYDHRTLQHHAAPHCWSDLLFKNTLNHRAKTIFQGLIRVAPGASQTDAYQTNRNLLLNPDAEADSLPGLEILNDDVKCSHGATTGEVNEEELFYMMTRGISPAAGKQLIALGFYEDVLERLGDEALREEVRTLIHAKFERSQKLRLEDSTPEAVESMGEEANVRRLQGTE
jgi:Fe-S cluster assembly protein SufD